MNPTDTPTPKPATPTATTRRSFAKRVGRRAVVFGRGFIRAISTMGVIALSLLPLAALLIALPAVSPSEAVLSDTVRPAKSWLRRTARRVLALVAGSVVLVAIFAFAIEVTSRLGLPPGGQLGTLAKKVLGTSVTDFLPDDANPALTEPLKGLLDRQAELVALLQRDDTAATARKEAESDLITINRTITDWAMASSDAWIIPAPLADRWSALREAGDEAKLTPVEKEIANLVAFALNGRLSPAELLEKQRTLRLALAKSNADPIAKAGSEKELALVEQELAERSPRVRKLRIMQDPDLAPILAKPLWTLLPPTLVQHWPFVFLIVYATDLGLLLLIGKVPLSYNLRYLWVRRRDTILTSVVFTVVVALVVVLLAFVNGMYKLNEGTGVPGNVMVLSEGSTDEIFSNLSRTDVGDIAKVTVKDGRGKPLSILQLTPGPNGLPLLGGDGKVIPLSAEATAEMKSKALYMASSETYMVMNQPVPTKAGEAQRRRLIQVRALEDCQIAAAVHNVELYPGGKWFPKLSVESKDGKTYLACCVGEGVAGTLGADIGKRRLEPGDTFRLGDEDWVVTGIMNTQGTTYGSEIWTGVNNTVVQGTGRGNKYTTLVMRMADNTEAASRGMATYLQDTYTQVKLKAFSEPEYYKELSKSNESFLICIAVVAGVMAVGGVFGVMNTMFASIAARIKEVGVMRILGFKRWQILIAFMLESLMIAFAGGLLGCVIGSAVDGMETSSNLSGGAGSGKSVALKMVVDYQIIAAGMLFTLVLGRLGGLVPALSAMRMEILDSLR